MKCKIKIAKVIKVRKRQIGTSVTSRDKSRKALKPGKRLSRNKKIYYENRKSRSDKNGLKIKAFKCK